MKSKTPDFLTDGLMLKPAKLGKKYVAVTPDGKTVDTKFVRRFAIKSALEGGYALKTVRTKNGGVQFRKATMAEFNAVSKTASPLTQTDVSQPVELPKEQQQILDFIVKANDFKPAGLIISDLNWRYLVRQVVRAQNVMMVGPTGCGKTMAIQEISKLLKDRPYFYFNMGATQDPRSTLIGNTHFAKDSGTFFGESLFVKAIQTPNAIILLDEMSREHPEAGNILMSVLDEKQRYLRIDEMPNTPTINVAEGVTFLATANIGAEYTGTRVMDRALFDRFTIIEMPYLTAEEEQGLLGFLYPSMKERDVKAISEISDHTRQQVMSDDPKVSTAISTRLTRKMAEAIVDGFSLAEAAEVCIFPYFSNAGGKDSERTYMRQLVQKYIPVEGADVVDGTEAWDKPLTDADKIPF